MLKLCPGHFLLPADQDVELSAPLVPCLPTCHHVPLNCKQVSPIERFPTSCCVMVSLHRCRNPKTHAITRPLLATTGIACISYIDAHAGENTQNIKIKNIK